MATPNLQGQLRTAEKFEFNYVNTMSDPAREDADCGAIVADFDNQPVAIVEEDALLAEKTTLARLKISDPLGGGRMTNGTPEEKMRVLADYAHGSSAIQLMK